MKKITVVFLLAALLLTLFSGCGSNNKAKISALDAPTSKLSAECDTILCKGYDTDGNFYELVANQTESSSGYEITVGVIKNNNWIYPLSSDFPFLGDRGVFHVSAPMGGRSGSTLDTREVHGAISFIDTGAFVMDCVETTSGLKLYEESYIIFSCNTLSSITLDFDTYTLLFATLSNTIQTDNGKLLVYSETSGTRSGWLEDQIFDIFTLDTKTLKLETVAANSQGLRPTSFLSEGLFFATDKCFYNTSMKKVIDLSSYSLTTDSNLYFENGKCLFSARNPLGNIFNITIDLSGNILSEEKAQ